MHIKAQFLPIFITMLPAFGALIVSLFGEEHERQRDNWVTFICTITTALAFLLFAAVIELGVVQYSLPWFLGFGLTFRVDFIGGLFAAVVTLVWLFASILAREYMGHEENRNRFYTFFTLTLGATAGVFLAGDLFSLFLFFEVMTFAAYVLVIHTESEAALRAGSVYLYMSIVGGLSLLGVVFLLEHVAGTTSFTPLLDVITANGINPWLILGAIIVGFGVKAGMVPLHVWLPKAHPVAPAPASALLSALMIKAWAYGFMRFLLTILTPIQEELWYYPQQFGYLFLWLGVGTMLAGAVMAVLSTSMKRLLAYSSISQMGYILFALGAAAFLGTRGAFGFAGAWMHMINHAFYKSFFFLLAGAVVLKTHALDFDKLGGLRRQMPWAFGFTLVAAAAITGIPGLNGYVSKILIHEAILEAEHLVNWPSLVWLERLFVVGGGLTAAYITKLWVRVFCGASKGKASHTEDISLSSRVLFGVYSVILLGIGLFAQTRVSQLVLPAAITYPFAAVDLAHLGEVPFWHVKELLSPLKAYAIGLPVLFLVTRFESQLHALPDLSMEALVLRPAVTLVKRGIAATTRIRLPHAPSIGIPDTNLAHFHLPRPQHSENHQDRSSFWTIENLTFDTLLVAIIIAILLFAFLFIRF